MIKCVLMSFTVLTAFVWNVIAQSFPPGAVIIEQQDITTNRQMVLWMKDPKQKPRGDSNEPYTCPEETRGSYYSGNAFVSLIDLRSRKVINTLQVKGGGVFGGDGPIDLPYWIHRGYYAVPKINKYKEGKPMLMNLKDYNNDGKPHEFALFEAIACMGLPSTLIGYSEKQDRVIQYQAEIKSSRGTRKSFWVDYFYTHKPNASGTWKYEIDYRGRGGSLDKYEIRYDAKQELFIGTLESTVDENDG